MAIRMNPQYYLTLHYYGPVTSQEMEENGESRNDVPQHRRAALSPLRVGVHPAKDAADARDEELHDDGNAAVDPMAILVEVFHPVCPNFLRRTLASVNGDVERAAAWITEQPAADIPKHRPENPVPWPLPEEVEEDQNLEPGRPQLQHFDSWSAFRRADFYSDQFWDNLSAADREQFSATTYRNEAEWRLKMDFKWIRMVDLQVALKRFKGRLALTHRIINDGIQQIMALRGIDQMNYLAKTAIYVDVLMLPGHYVPANEEKLHLLVLDEPRESELDGKREEEYDYAHNGRNMLLAKEVEWMELVERQEEQLRQPHHPVAPQAMAANGNPPSDKAAPEEVIECVICANVFHLNEARSCQAGHQFCRTCVESYADETVFGQGKGTVRCMLGNCAEIFSRAVLQQTLRPKCLKHLDSSAEWENVRAAGIGGLQICKSCGFAVQIEQSPKELRAYTCPKPTCRKTWCRVCDLPWNEEHIGKKCSELQTDILDDARKRFDEQMADAVIRRCGDCWAPIVIADGCNLITCSCGNTFCYLCYIQNVTPAHFCLHAHDAGQLKCNECDLPCRLYENAELRDQEKLRELDEEKDAIMAKLEADCREAAKSFRRNQEANEGGANTSQAIGESANKGNKEKQPNA